MDALQAAHPSCGVLYPLQSMSKERSLSMKEVPLLIEGSSTEVTAMIRELAEGMSDEVHERSSDQRLIIHTAAVFANNFTNHMIRISEQMLAEAGESSQLIIPLLRETFGKAEAMGAAAAQTGPAIRGDSESMRKHLEILERYPEWKKLYTFISQDIGRSRKD